MYSNLLKDRYTRETSFVGKLKKSKKRNTIAKAYIKVLIFKYFNDMVY
jgi:hypothetical protein